MSRKKSVTTLIRLCIALILGLFLSGLPTRIMAGPSTLQVQGQAVKIPSPTWIALRQNNERRRLPGRREPAAGRGCGLSMPQPPLTALTPETNLGFTVAAYPKFFFYIPQLSAKAVKFSLLKEDKNKIYEKTFPIPSTAGIFHLSLPANQTLPPLEVGKDYHWYFQIICPGQDGGNSYVDGWVQRIEPHSSSVSQLNRTISSENVTRYHKTIFWYDVLATLAEKRSSNPKDVSSSSEWTNLLRSEGLHEIAREPVVGSIPEGTTQHSESGSTRPPS